MKIYIRHISDRGGLTSSSHISLCSLQTHGCDVTDVYLPATFCCTLFWNALGTEVSVNDMPGAPHQRHVSRKSVDTSQNQEVFDSGSNKEHVSRYPQPEHIATHAFI